MSGPKCTYSLYNVPIILKNPPTLSEVATSNTMLCSFFAVAIIYEKSTV